MSTIRVIGREDIQKVFTVTAALRAVESAYAGKSAGTGRVWPMVFHEFDPGHADLDIKSGDLGGLGFYGLKVVSWFGANPGKGLPALYGTSLLFDLATGAPRALLNAGPITDFRTGAAGAIAHAIRAVTQPGDEVLTFAPYFPEYGPYVEGTGAHLRVVPPQAPAFQPNLEAFEQMLTEKVTCVLINTPNNPTGVVYSADTLIRLAEILTEKSRAYGHNIFLVSDEPYRDIAFDGRAVPYPAAFYPHTLTCFSFSKSLSLPGERLGYVAVRPGCEGEEVLVDMMAQISRFTGHNCPPSIIQRAVSRCLDVTSDLSVYETNMDLLYNKLKALGFEVERPGGTFYLFPKALEEDANAFCRRAREFDLLLVPSDTFGVTGYVRLAYCIDTEKVKRSLPALEKLAAAYQ